MAARVDPTRAFLSGITVVKPAGGGVVVSLNQIAQKKFETTLGGQVELLADRVECFTEDNITKIFFAFGAKSRSDQKAKEFVAICASTGIRVSEVDIEERHGDLGKHELWLIANSQVHKDADLAKEILDRKRAEDRQRARVVAAAAEREPLPNSKDPSLAGFSAKRGNEKGEIRALGEAMHSLGGGGGGEGVRHRRSSEGAAPVTGAAAAVADARATVVLDTQKKTS